MKTLITLAFVLAAGAAFATDLKVPGKSKQTMAKSPAPVVQTTPPEMQNACLARVAAECEAKNWTWSGNW